MTTNGALAAMLQSIEKKFDERHEDNKERLNRILEQATLTNSRVNKAEQAIAVHWWAIGLIGAASLAAFGALVYKAFM